MRTVLLLLLAPMLLASLAHADPDDLSGGVFIAHAPPGVVYTNETASWCDSTYLTACENQVNRIETDTEAVWFVLSAWDEEKSFSGVEFGLGDFEPESFVFMADGLCLDDAMAIHHPGVEAWPGPNTGIALAANGDAWTGRLVPVAWFAGYNYAAGDTIAITENPATGHAGWLSGDRLAYDAACLGWMGLGGSGLSCCPEGERSVPESGKEEGACCFQGVCRTTTAQGCDSLGGNYLGSQYACDEQPCVQDARSPLGIDCDRLIGCGNGVLLYAPAEWSIEDHALFLNGQVFERCEYCTATPPPLRDGFIKQLVDANRWATERSTTLGEFRAQFLIALQREIDNYDGREMPRGHLVEVIEEERGVTLVSSEGERQYRSLAPKDDPSPLKRLPSPEEYDWRKTYQELADRLDKYLDDGDQLWWSSTFPGYVLVSSLGKQDVCDIASMLLNADSIDEIRLERSAHESVRDVLLTLPESLYDAYSARPYVTAQGNRQLLVRLGDTPLKLREHLDAFLAGQRR